MIYGANGYRGHLVAAEAKRRGLNPVLAGRRAAPIEKLAAELGLSMRVFDLDDAPAAIRHDHRARDLSRSDCVVVWNIAVKAVGAASPA